LDIQFENRDVERIINRCLAWFNKLSYSLLIFYLYIVMHTKVIGKSKMYKVNNESPIVRQFNKLMFELATVRNYYELKKQGYVKQAEQLIEGSKYFPSSK
jgi:hypothetical protein